MRPDTWWPAPGMRFTLPALDDGLKVAEVHELGLNRACRCSECPCYFVAIDDQWAGQFSAAELRGFDFTPDNTVTGSGPEPVRLGTGYFTFASEEQPAQQALEV